MAKITDKTVKSKYPPKQVNVTWIDTSQKPAVTKSYIDGQWVVVGGGGGTKKYSDLEEKPSINGVELDGNKTSQDIGVYSKPSDGIPQSDLSSDVQSQLNKHFKGWFASVGYLETEYPSPVVGDYAYVKGAESTDPAAIYECTTAGSWSDSGRTVDTSNVQTFASGEEVNEVHIVNDLTTGGTDDVLSAEQGKILNEKTTKLLDVNQELILTKYINSSLIWKQDVSYVNNNCLKIQIQPGKSYVVKYKSGDLDTNLTTWNYLSDWPTTLEESVESLFVDNHPMTTFPSKVGFNTGIIPQGANYLYIRCGINNNYPTGLNANNDYDIYVEEDIKDLIPEVDSTNLENPNNDSVSKATDVSILKHVVGSSSFKSQKLDYTTTEGYTITGQGAFMNGIPADNYSIKNLQVGDFSEFRFSGIIKSTQNGINSAGYAFGYYLNNDSSTEDNWRSIVSEYFDVDETLSDVTEKEYIITKPSISKITHLRITHFKLYVNDFYVYGSKNNTIIGEIDNLKKDKDSKELFIGSVVQKSINASGYGSSNHDYRVSMESVIAVPYLGVTIHFDKLPQWYAVGVRHGDRAENLSVNSYWFRQGDNLTLTNNGVDSRYYRLSFSRKASYFSSGTPTGIELTLDVLDIQALINNGEIKFSFNSNSDIVSDNKEQEKYVFSTMRNFYSSANLNNTVPNLPVFAHTSDIHGDAVRFERFMQYCDFLGVDAALITGDFAAYASNNGCYYINDIADKHSTMVLPCTGNHDVRGLYTAQEQNEQVIGYLIEKNNVTTNPLEGSYPTYFYKDFASKKIRVISLNLHEGQRSQTDGCNFTQVQAEWFAQCLASTPQDYGILILYHEPESQVKKDNNYDAFYQSVTTTTIYQAGITGTPISDIVDAFISKTQATISYTTQGNEVSIQVDFTSVASGVEFIAHVCGHEHVDWIGIINNKTNRQLVLDITCGVGIYGNNYPYLANISDIVRNKNTSIQDAFNIYSIDRVNKTVRIARVGSNITSELKDRKTLIIPYAIS